MCSDCAVDLRRKLDTTFEEKREIYRDRYQKRRHAFKDEIIEMYGDNCWVCGDSYPRCVYVFHHIDSSEKDRVPATVFRTTDWSKAEEELVKCVMLCQNCHALVHWGDKEIDIEKLRPEVERIWEERVSLIN